MTRLLWLLSVALTAVVLGAATAIWTVQTLRPTGMIRIGPWEAVRAVGDAAADPYAHAFIATSGQLPPGSAEGLRFVATESSHGSALRPDCTITLSGQVEIARLWTLSVLGEEGRAGGVPAPSLHSQDIVYRRDGGFELTIGPRPGTANALLAGGTAPVTLVLHVYDGAISSPPDTGAAALPLVAVGRDGPDC